MRKKMWRMEWVNYIEAYATNLLMLSNQFRTHHRRTFYWHTIAIFFVFFKVFEVHDHWLNSMIKILNIKTGFSSAFNYVIKYFPLLFFFKVFNCHEWRTNLLLNSIIKMLNIKTLPLTLSFFQSTLHCHEWGTTISYVDETTWVLF